MVGSSIRWAMEAGMAWEGHLLLVLLLLVVQLLQVAESLVSASQYHRRLS